MTIIREANAVWDGNIADGAGHIELGPEAQGYFNEETRFTNGKHHNPESLAAGALAGCYAMSLAERLTLAGVTPAEIHVAVRIFLDKDVDDAPFIPTVAINARVQINNIDHDAFLELADDACMHCPMANLYAGADITLKAETVGS